MTPTDKDREDAERYRNKAGAEQDWTFNSPDIAKAFLAGRESCGCKTDQIQSELDEAKRLLSEILTLIKQQPDYWLKPGHGGPSVVYQAAIDSAAAFLSKDKDLS